MTHFANPDTVAMRGSGSILVAGAAIWICVVGAAASAQTSRCFENGDIVTFDGVASAGATPSQWLFNLSQPICMASNTTSSTTDVSTVRIVGTPPPLGIPLELVGKLMLGHSAADSAIYVALVVRRGRKIRTTQSVAPSPRTASLPPAAPGGHVAAKCDAPPYGGTSEDYHAFVQRFGHIVKPEKILADVCNAKFGNSPRDQLHRLGLTDSRIDSENTEHLAADTIVALKNLVNKFQ